MIKNNKPKEKRKESPCVFLYLCLKGSTIRLADVFCQPDIGLQMQTSYSIFEFVFQSLGIVFFDK